MVYNIRQLEMYFLSLGGKKVDGEYSLPMVENARIKHLDSKITKTLLEYRHTIDKNALRAKIPSYKRKLKEARDAEVQKLEAEKEAEREKSPNYTEAKIVKTLLDAVSNARRQLLIGEDFSRESVAKELEANGGKMTKLSGKRRTRLYVYEPPVIESESITKLNDAMVEDMGKYTSTKYMVGSAIPGVRKAREARLLANIDRLDMAIRDEKMEHKEYRNATALIAVLQAMDTMEKSSAYKNLVPTNE